MVGTASSDVRMFPCDFSLSALIPKGFYTRRALFIQQCQ